MRFLLNINTFLICIIICVITIAAMPANNKQEDLIRTTPRPNIIVSPPRLCPPGQKSDSFGICREVA
ncbi:hypothetical protein M0804_011464 [Polistes exclamans]|nr:hypothetical protein M0804_011464 [Polistes exclamans]